MSTIDWIVLFATLLLIVGYGVYKTYGPKSMDNYLRGDSDMNWWTIGLSIMATQASAITFLSTPGQAYEDGMRFIQFYFGLPIAMIILSVTFIPIYYKLKVYTAYEFLENRFDLKTRTLAALLFLTQRGLAAGITIYAPAIILSTLLGWNLFWTNIFIGVLVILYTVSGGTKAVSITQKQQMAVMMGGMILAGIFVVKMLPVGFSDALHVAGKMDRLNIINFEFDLADRYNVWSGMTAALFLFLSYFGTDQSQVQRYLTGKSLAESRMGLIMNGLLKIPMQFIILFIGVMVFVFYQFFQPPVVFNKVQTERLINSEYEEPFSKLEDEYSEAFEQKSNHISELLAAVKADDEQGIRNAQSGMKASQKRQEEIRNEVKSLIVQNEPNAETKDTDYVFMRFVMDYLPIGIVGLLFAVIFSAAMSSTASELNSLGTTSTIDIYKRSLRKNESDKHYMLSSKWLTALWGVFAILFATYASLFENLIQAVNLLGSLFYGTILGIFLVGFYMKWIKGHAVFIAALIAEAIILMLHWFNGESIIGIEINIGFLWYNAIGCILVMVLAALIQLSQKKIVKG
ncbi:sodium:solute symporter [Belliella kenyensis]|uniref:Sodium:solute symporter n=1 Tax=Belliella kenyensis TaxID=1472724 RepID=A0ABV8ELK6_9BACT|nr:sodium:solute symporter [Belliella kenyensis]MCH7403224.1 sodium:solute symporter [Belliella kenyensis]MDN3604835.1 sodium:solute symporter [Belliella kenyensis]